MAKQIWILVGILMLIGVQAMAIEEARYNVVKSSGIFEVRDYEAHILAEIIVDGTLEEAGFKAFRPLFRYISGDNHSRKPIDMTAPVSQQATGEKISMTAPVSQQAIAGKWAVSFVMPASFSLETVPIPDNGTISLRQVPSHRVAAVKYSGFWSEKKYQRYKRELEAWMQANNFKGTGEPVWARYNPPFSLWFLRRNEILIPIATD
ncbi:MAG: heme-binding protein [Dissulfurispiraceae bacterium]